MSQRVKKPKSLLSDELQINWLSEMQVLLRSTGFISETHWPRVRQLGLPDINQCRRGILTAIYHHISKNLKAGVGYNFTEFSDELTDVRYHHRQSIQCDMSHCV